MIKLEEAVPDQRANLFYTQGMVQGKTCLIVIDTGSCTNVASAGWVSKLGLQVEQHPKPYALHWLSPQGAVHIHKQVRVPLTLGDYTDEIMCDVVPMEATHLILGRPWQYDLRAKYDGYTNECIIQQQGKEYKLLPMSPVEVQQARLMFIKKPKGKRSLFMWSNRVISVEATAKDSRSNLLQQGGNDRNPRAIKRVPKKSTPNQSIGEGTKPKGDGNKYRESKRGRAASNKPALKRRPAKNALRPSAFMPA